MVVGDIMQSRLVTVTSAATLAEAMTLLQQRGIRHLPVVDGALVGILSDRDLKRAMGPSGPDGGAGAQPVAGIMTRHVVTIGRQAPVEEAARIMLDEKISALPVIEGGRLVGIVTETDVVGLFVRVMGVGEPSSRLDVLLGDRPDGLGEVVRTIEDAGARISSIVTLTRADLREAVVRVATINPGPVIAALAARGFTVRDSSRRPAAR
jgi:acetoin utilization protein AcuB